MLSWLSRAARQISPEPEAPMRTYPSWAQPPPSFRAVRAAGRLALPSRSRQPHIPATRPLVGGMSIRFELISPLEPAAKWDLRSCYPAGHRPGSDPPRPRGPSRAGRRAGSHRRAPPVCLHGGTVRGNTKCQPCRQYNHVLPGFRSEKNQLHNRSGMVYCRNCNYHNDVR